VTAAGPPPAKPEEPPSAAEPKSKPES
jgi:hypothetical protein